MMTSRGRHIVALAAGITVLVYVALVGLSTGCLFIHAASSAEHDHHGQDFSHSPLCIWSCQALSQSALTSAPTTPTAWIVESARIPVQVVPAQPLAPERLRARAPPQSILS